MKIETRQLHVPIIRPIKKFTALSDAGTGVVQLFFLVLGGVQRRLNLRDSLEQKSRQRGGVVWPPAGEMCRNSMQSDEKEGGHG
jgi:hypothetical protein